MSATTYFGDVVTTGNTNIVQTMTAFGNVTCNQKVFINGDVGTAASPFGAVYVKSMNVATMNVSTFQAGQIITGNVVASNAYEGPNLFASLMNVTGVSNTFSLVVKNPNVGIGTAVVVPAHYETSTVSVTAPPYGFGYEVALSADGTTMVSCASGGYGFVYRYSGGWGAAQTFTGTPTGGGDNWGKSIGISSDGNTIIVGAPLYNDQMGYAAIFRYSGGSWGSEQQLVSTAPIGGPTNPRFGWAVSISGDGNTALVGAYTSDNENGWAAVYRYSGGAWGSATSLTPPPNTGGIDFGWWAKLSGDGQTAFVGSTGTRPAVYRYSGGVWTLAQQIFPTYVGTTWQSGVSVSYDGNTIALGNFSYNSGEGIVGVYNYSGGAWPETLINSTAGAGAGFGKGLAISSIGNILVIGAPLKSPNEQGYAAVFTSSGGSWSFSRELVYSFTYASYSSLGISLGVSSTGDLIVSGSQRSYVASFFPVDASFGGSNLLVQGNVYMENVSTTNVSLYNLLNVSATMNTGTLITPLSINPVYQLPKDSSTLTNVLGGTTNFGSNLSSSGDGSRFVTFPSFGVGAYLSFAYNFTSNVFGGYWDMYNIIQITTYVGPTNGYASAFSYDGNTLIIGEPSGSGGFGLATVYKPGGVGGYWAGTPLNPGSVPAGFGAAIAISPEGDVAVVGAPSTNFNTGIAWAYKYSNGAWSDPISIPYSGFVNYYFGYSVAVCSSTTGGMAGGGPGTNTLLVGAPGAAAVYMYALVDNTVYYNTTFTFGLSASDWLGYSLSISYDGYLAIAGAPYYSAGVGTVITFGNGGNQTLTSPAGAGGNFGTSVGLAPNGLTAAVGAPNASSGAGYAAKYTLSTPTYTWSSATQLVRPVSTSSFGKSIAVSFCGILVGSASEKVIFFSLLGYPTAGANLAITGNAWVSNIVTTPNVFATTINAATLTTTTLSTTGLIDVGPGVSATTFEVTGNVFVSNALVTQNLFANIYSTRANVRTINATTVDVQSTTGISSTLNVNTINVLSISASSLYNILSAPFSSTLQFSGSDTNQHFGWSDALSYDGLTAIIGAPNPSSSPGSVSIYRYSGGSWNYQSGLSSAAVTGANPRFGSAVSLSSDGNIALVGAYNSGSGVGYAAVYRFSAGTWGAATALTGPGGTSYFGWSVALSSDGNTAIVGAYLSNWAGVYKYNGSSWSSATALTSGGTQFGWAVSLSYNGNTAIVGAPGANSAKVFVYSGTWDAGTSLVSTAGAGANFGSGVSLSSDGNTAIVGAGAASSGAGYAAIFKYTGGSWGSASQLPYSPVANDGFGYATSISSNGDVAAVFAYNSNRARPSYAVVFYNLLSGSPSSYTFPSFSNYPASSLYYGGQTSLSSTGATMIYGGQGGSFIYSIIFQGGVNNIYASNTLSSTNLSVTNTIYYNEDLTKRSLYLQPSSTNASAIQSAISAACNAVSKSYWCTSPKPVYGNVLSVSATSNAYSGGVYLPDGRVVFVPSKSTNIGIFNPATSAFTSVTGVPPGYNGGVLLPNGNVLFVPQKSNIGMFNPVNSSFSNIGTPLLGQSYNGVLSPRGVWLTPSSYSSAFGAGFVYLYDTSINQTTQQFSTEMVPSMSSAAGTGGAGVSVAYALVLAKYSSINANGTSYYSSDGKTWTLSTGATLASIDPTCQWKSVAASSTRFAAVGVGGAYNSAYSDDGNSWSVSPSYASLFSVNTGGFWTSVVYVSGPNYYLAMSPYGSATLAFSNDGIGWSPCSTQLPNGFGTNYVSLTVDSTTGIIYVIGQGGSLCCQQLSGDPRYGGYWTQAGGFDFIGKNWTSVTTHNNMLVAVGPDGSAWWSATGNYYWAVGNPSLSSISSAAWNSVTWSTDLNLYIATGPSIAFSRDGKAWYSTSPTVYQTYPNSWNSVVSGLSTNIFVVVGTGDPTTNTAWSYNSTDGYNTGSILLPTGNVLFSPIGSSNLIQLNPIDNFTSNIMLPPVGGINGLVLAPDGNVVAVPSGSYVYVINPNLSSLPYNFTNITTVGPIAGSVTNLFKGGTLLPSSNVVFASGTSSNVGMFDPVNFTYSNCTLTGTSGVAFSGATLLPSGQVVFTPYDSANVGILDTFTPVSQELCLSPYFNKF